MRRVLLAIFMGSQMVGGRSAGAQPVPAPASAVPGFRTVTVEAKRPRQVAYRPMDTLLVTGLTGFDGSTVDRNLDEFGGDRTKVGVATGYFHVQKLKDRWWLIDPGGSAFVSKGIAGIDPDSSKVTADALRSRFGTKAQWAQQTVAMMTRRGFNSSGAWSRNDLLTGNGTKIPHTVTWRFAKAFRESLGIDDSREVPTLILHPGFESFCDVYARQAVPMKDRRWLIGYFSDNEIPFNMKLLDDYLSLPTSDPARLAMQEWALKHFGAVPTPAAVNDVWRQEFYEFVVDRYFRITSKAIRTHDPNHLLLGSRLWEKDFEIPAIFRIAGQYLDVITVNYYATWTPDRRLTGWAVWSGKPILVGEFYALGMDTGMHNDCCGGWVVKTQADRGAFYENFTLGLLRSKVCVGWHWFRYMDNDPNDPSAESGNRTSNKGIVTITFDEYQPLLDHMGQVNTRAYSLIDFFDGPGGAH